MNCHRGRFRPAHYPLALLSVVIVLFGSSCQTNPVRVWNGAPEGTSVAPLSAIVTPLLILA